MHAAMQARRQASSHGWPRARAWARVGDGVIVAVACICGFGSLQFWRTPCAVKYRAVLVVEY
jgi:hypothetical protein